MKSGVALWGFLCYCPFAIQENDGPGFVWGRFCFLGVKDVRYANASMIEANLAR
jgi:hypothetical protein